MLFLIIISLSAFLLFQIQPIIAKVILPHYGGSSSVWTSCMLFFQTTLLFGYSYAHLLQKLKFKYQFYIHIFLIVTMIVIIPFNTPEVVTDTFKSPIVNIIYTLFLAVGIPLLMLCTTAPLIQHWYALSQTEKIPYQLYSFSNVGSLLALLSYPMFFEPLFKLGQQFQIWSIGLLILVGLLVWLLFTLKYSTKEEANLSITQKTPIALSRITLWLIFSALGVAALVSGTNELTQNVAPIPLLWVIPLSLYLITFIIIFYKPDWYVRWYWLTFFVICAFVAVLMHVIGSYFNYISQLFIYTFILFSSCMICHGELYRLAPDKNQLTLYYLIIALGGVIGSGFVSIASPLLFDEFTEYRYTLFTILFFCIISYKLTDNIDRNSKEPNLFTISVLSIILIGLTSFNWFVSDTFQQNKIASSRNFYGLLSIVDVELNNKRERRLIDGSTSHGTQSLEPHLSHIPKSYYRENTGAALTLRHLKKGGLVKKGLNVGLIGLGTGALAMYADDNDKYEFLELNPNVVDFATTYFSFLSQSRGQVNIEIGDGRYLLTQAIENSDRKNYDALVIDAFSGGAIPVHLLTAEAFKLYAEHMSANGVIAVHISNSHLDFSGLIRNLANEIDKEAYYFLTEAAADEPNKTEWVLITSNQDFINDPIVARYKSYWPISEKDNLLWTDNYSNILSIIR